MSSHQSQPAKRGAVWRPRQRAHWWLASVLVGCLLPATLVHAEALRLAERLTQVYLMAPETLRAESLRAERVTPTRPRQCAAPALPCVKGYRAPIVASDAAFDVISRRGPPGPL